MMAKKSYDKIAPTAWGVAYRRTFCDIPYSKEIFDQVEKLRKKNKEPKMPEVLKAEHITPQIEARYKLTDRLLAQSKIKQVLEIASGLSPRGLAASEKGNINYVELDLPSMMAQKRAILKKIKRKLPDNLLLKDGNALSLDDLQAAISHFDKSKPIAIINEGLLRYLNFDEKTQVANNVHSILEKFGGVWITPDITLKNMLKRQGLATKGYTKAIQKITSIDLEKNRFENVSHAKKFFGKLGFKIESHKFTEIKSELVSPAKLNMPDSEVRKNIDPAVIFVMRVK